MLNPLFGTRRTEAFIMVDACGECQRKRGDRT